MAKKQTDIAERQRKFREAHKPDAPPFIGIWLRHGDAACLAAGLITDSLKQLAVDALAEFWPPETIMKELTK